MSCFSFLLFSSSHFALVGCVCGLGRAGISLFLSFLDPSLAGGESAAAKLDLLEAMSVCNFSFFFPLFVFMIALRAASRGADGAQRTGTSPARRG